MAGRSTPLLVIVVAVAVAVFLFFRAFSLQDFPPFAKEILAALLGSVLTVTITAVLLRYQTASELDRDKSVAVFQEKLKMYEGFCVTLSEMTQNGSLGAETEHELRLWAMRLSLVSGQEVSKAIDHFFMQTHRYRSFYFDVLSDAQRQDLVTWHREFYGTGRGARDRDPAQCFMSIGSLIAHLKHDLGEFEVSSLQDVASAKHAVDDIIRMERTV
jgi:hypothetical protein